MRRCTRTSLPNAGATLSRPTGGVRRVAPSLMWAGPPMAPRDQAFLDRERRGQVAVGVDLR